MGEIGNAVREIRSKCGRFGRKWQISWILGENGWFSGEKGGFLLTGGGM